MAQSQSLLLTMGDPMGIGPEVIVKSLSNLNLKKNDVTVIGVCQAFERWKGWKKLASQNNIHFIDVGTVHSAKSKKVQWSKKECGELSFLALKKAVSLIKSGTAKALVTAPISKENIHLAGFQFPGHTEYLCHEFGVKKFAMMLFHERLRVVLTTIHVPLQDVPRLMTKKNIIEKLFLTANSLKKDFGIKKPRIAVCGLNPHAGEGGLIGDEEKKIILPAMRKFSKSSEAKNVVVTGPISSDAVFHQALNGKYDAVLCHYHDQGLIPLKVTGFESGVNLTLGLPFVRTSPDHGTAFDIAGIGIANAASMMAAIGAALKF